MQEKNIIFLRVEWNECLDKCMSESETCDHDLHLRRYWIESQPWPLPNHASPQGDLYSNGACMHGGVSPITTLMLDFHIYIVIYSPMHARIAINPLRPPLPPPPHIFFQQHVWTMVPYEPAQVKDPVSYEYTYRSAVYRVIK